MNGELVAVKKIDLDCIGDFEIFTRVHLTGSSLTSVDTCLVPAETVH